MPSIRQKTNKAGKTFYEIRVSRGRDNTYLTKRWYAPEGWSQKAIDKELTKQAAEFERMAQSGEVISLKEKKAAEKEARRIAAAEAAKLKTVRQYAEGVFMPTKEAYLSKNAIDQYIRFLEKHILPEIGEMQLVEVTPAVIQKLLIDFQKAGYAHASCVKLYNILNGLFQMAFMDDSIPLSPMLKVKRPAPRKDEKQIPESEKALTADKLNYVLECAAKEPLKWYAYILLSADTWARRGEICALAWSDIDFSAGTVTISKNLQYNGRDGVFETTPKNGKTRVVDIGTDTLNVLRQWRQEQSQSCISKYVFTQEGLPDRMHPQSPSRYFYKFSKKYGVNLHPHLLRHTGASLATTNNADVASISERLGHSDTAVTLRMYAHANEESIRRAGQTARDAVKKQA